MRIGEVAASSGVTTKALRFYEERGLLPQADRSTNGYRDYPQETLGRIEFIRRSQVAGLSLSEIRGILRIRDAGEAPCGHVRDQLSEHLRNLDRQIAELTALRESVAGFYEIAAAGDPNQCNAERICSYL
ncbi:heavy metal-responsive transcriptional regulator [Arthrobacter sp. TMN-50]